MSSMWSVPVLNVSYSSRGRKRKFARSVPSYPQLWQSSLSGALEQLAVMMKLGDKGDLSRPLRRGFRPLEWVSLYRTARTGAGVTEDL